MLETPLFGRFGKENRRLVFGPTPAYDLLVHCTAGFGVGLALLGKTGGFGIINPPFSEDWCVYTGLAVALAATWAYLSLVRINFDLKNMTYKRRQGPGFLPKVWSGPVADLDALVLIAEPGASGTVTYHLVLYWKQQKQPSMVVQNDTRSLRPGEPMQAGGVMLMQRGVAYAKAMGIPFYDNSHFASRCPIPVF